MDTLEKTISNFIEQQFPAVFRELGPTFVLFVKLYYEWLEEPDNVLYNTRRLYEYRDVDETTERFLIHFKETYLKNIQLDTVQNTRTLIKHSLDLYRSKGTQQSIELLFRLAFGTDAEIYYPRQDILKPSDGYWFEPEYLEVTLKETNGNYVGKQVIGDKSKAKAFVEKVVRRYGKNHTLIDLLYISAREGNFKTGETLSLLNDTLPIDERTSITGSLSSLEVDVNGSGANFEVGDIVNLFSNTGVGGKARITEIVETTGQVTLELIDGGYGYNANSYILISEKILTVNGQYNFSLLEEVYQPLANINYLNATGNFSANDLITTYYANGSSKGTARILSVNITNTSAGNLFVEILTGNVQANAFYTSGNLVSANQSLLDGYEDKRASGNVVGWSTNATSNTTKIGVMGVTNSFHSNGTFFYSSVTNYSNKVVSVSHGTGFTFSISNSLLYEEYMTVNDDVLRDYKDVLLSANNYGFHGSSPTTNVATLLSAINWANTIFGKIQKIVGLNPGTAYNDFPFISIYDPLSVPFERHDYVLTLNQSPFPFEVGELVTQSATSARGIVVSKNTTSNTITLQNLRLSSNNDFRVTSNSTTIISGIKSNFQANVTAVNFDLSSNVAGWNAVMSTKLNTANGASKLKVFNSGFAYKDGEYLQFSKDENSIGYAFANVSTQGKGEGYYKVEGGVLSGNKRIYDGYYYQEFSYDIMSSLTLDKYQKLLKDVVHTAGYALFGTVKHKTNIQAIKKTAQSAITVT
jgi:hypothetical protein